MFEQLAAVENRFEQISVELTRPEIISDNEQFTKLIKEHGELSPIVEKYREYTAAQRSLEEAEEILSSQSGDKDLKELAEEELKDAKQTIA
ncbi:MAG: PCRF domain-containing protein, partial [Clostridia bacterium]|nr:PCRF domain-containing protein [Clostridia bacterium]